jgi:hypothetical protein
MARLLYDSLPEFVPVQLTSWDPRIVGNLVSRHPGSVLPSVVIGDFNGDSQTDLALWGNYGERSAMFMLLAASDTAPEPRIIRIGEGIERISGIAEGYISLVRPQKIVVDTAVEDQPLDLRTDAVLDVTIDKFSLIYYLDRGVVRRYLLSD